MPNLGRGLVATVLGACALLLGGCGPARSGSEADAIAVGALLPFTGKEAAVGPNLERALLLAVADVNAAGGIGGRKLRLVTRDSNSGSERGLEQLLELLYVDHVEYLIGPEETNLANAIVPDVKGLNVLDILPGYAAPAIEHPGRAGAWVRLAPSTNAFGCAMGKQVIRDGARTVNALIGTDDYDASLTSDFFAHVGSLGAVTLPSVTAAVGASTYVKPIQQAIGYGADITLLATPPESAATIATEWTVDGRRGHWYLSPLLRTDALLENIPFGTLNGARGISPSSSLASECAPSDDEVLHCTHTNAQAFAAHFSDYWQGDKPFAAANYYYDAVVLLALGLDKGLAETGELPNTQALHTYIRALGNADAQPVRWNDLSEPVTEIRLGSDVRYIGAAAEYDFDVYGAAQHTVFDTWTVANDAFVGTDTLEAICPLVL